MTSNIPMLHVGEIVRTNYDSGPYRITDVAGPCTCRSYGDHINCLHSAGSQPHYHLTCVDASGPAARRRQTGLFYLNGYRHDGTCVWSNDYLIFPFRSQPYAVAVLQQKHSDQ